MNDRSSFRAKRSLGQNFLTDPNYIRRIIEAVAPAAEDTVIEIGPGRGALTERLVTTGANVTAIELDRDLIRPLRERFSSSPNFRLVEADILEVDLRTLVEVPVKLVANLPYYISTAILQRLAEQREGIAFAVLMFQKEVVERMTAPPGSSERGYLTVLTEMSFEVRKLFDVPPSAFRPAPKVTSSVARLTPVQRGHEDEAGLRQLLAFSFRQKRKTLLNNLKSVHPVILESLERSGIDGSRRAESLTLEEWYRLHAALRQ